MKKVKQNNQPQKTMTEQKKEFIRAGEIGGIKVMIFSKKELIKVWTKYEWIAHKEVKGISEFIRHAGELRLGWAKMENGDEVIYIYDKSDGNYGYALNLDNPQNSEWGYAPFTKSKKFKATATE